MFISWVLALLLIVTSFFSLLDVTTQINANNAVTADQNAFLQDQTTQVQLWYQSNISSIDNQSGAVAPTLSTGRWGLTALVSNLVSCGDGIWAHKFALVIPSVKGLRTTMNPATGVVNAGTGDIYNTIDGCIIEEQLVIGSENSAMTVISSLENYFRGAQLQSGGNTTENYFSSPSCGGWGNIPCTTDSTVDTLQPYIGLVNGDCYSSYGLLLHYDNNSSAVATTGPPYMARVGFDTPWGVRTWMMASYAN